MEQVEASQLQVVDEAHAIMPARQLKEWYAGMDIEHKLAALLMAYLAANGNEVGEEIRDMLEEEVFAAEDLPAELREFRWVYHHVKQLL